LGPAPATPEGPKPHAGHEADDRRSQSRDPGDARDFEAFFKTNYRPLVWTLMRMGATTAEAEDVLQETMLLIYGRWSEIKEPLGFARVAAVRALLRTKRRSQDLTSRLAAGGWLPVPWEEAKLESADGTEVRAVLDLISRLPAKQREVMALTFDGYTANEIAKMLQIKVSTVGVHLHRARQALRDALKESAAAE
jgi:RNA polymerase sigma-70 factor (ECF subfamily)